MKTKKILMLVVMLAVSTTVIRANQLPASEVAEVSNVLKKSLIAPSDAAENFKDGTVYAFFSVDENHELQLFRVWSHDLSQKDLLDIEMQLISFEEKHIKYAGEEKIVPIKILFRIYK